MSDLLPCNGDAFAPVSGLALPVREHWQRCIYCVHAAHEVWCGCGSTKDEGKCLGNSGYLFAAAAGIVLQRTGGKT